MLLYAGGKREEYFFPTFIFVTVKLLIKYVTKFVYYFQLFSTSVDTYEKDKLVTKFTCSKSLDSVFVKNIHI